MFPGSGLDHAADVKDNNDFLSGLMVGVADVLEIGNLYCVEAEITLSVLAVTAFSCITSDCEDGNVCTSLDLCHKCLGKLSFRKNRLAPQCVRSVVVHCLFCI